MNLGDCFGPVKIAVASGKGGTGKTTVSLNLAKVFESPVQLVDCDVEEPNAHLFLEREITASFEITIPVPEVNQALCNHCCECSTLCQYGAIAALPKSTMVFPELCHGCGGCALVCPRRAIREIGRRIGVVEESKVETIRFVRGCLDIGVAMAPPLIRAVKERILADLPAIIDAPPGTSCPVISALVGVDYAVLVTEPTPFGLNDLQLAVELLRTLGIPFGVVLNRVGVGDERVIEFCRKEQILILAKIPDDRRIAEAYSRGIPTVEALPEYRNLFVDLLSTTVGTLTERNKHAHLSV